MLQLFVFFCFRGARCTQWLLLILGLFSLAAGLIMVIEGAVDIGNKHQHEVDSSNSNLPEGESTGKDTY